MEEKKKKPGEREEEIPKLEKLSIVYITTQLGNCRARDCCC
jgi:hypothetical protein